MSLKKRQSLTISQKRAADFYFQRVHDVFERKFDGFPAQILDVPTSTIKDASGNVLGFNAAQLAEEIAKQIQAEQQQNKVVSCDPVTPEVGTSGSTVLENDLSGGPTTFVAAKPVRYWIKVWFDSVPAAKTLDWNDCDGNLCVVTPTTATVSAEYVVA